MIHKAIFRFLNVHNAQNFLQMGAPFVNMLSTRHTTTQPPIFIYTPLASSSLFLFRFFFVFNKLAILLRLFFRCASRLLLRAQ